MSDYERINATVQANVSNRRNNAYKLMAKALFKALVALCLIIGLKAVGFISVTFMVILEAVTVCKCTFNIGVISRDIK